MRSAHRHGTRAIRPGGARGIPAIHSGLLSRLCPWAVVSALLLAPIQGCQPRIDSDRLNLVIIWVDTLRADHLGCYGYTRPTSRNIDSLAAEGTLFTRAVSQSPWTLPSTASLLTGLYPTRHGATNRRARLPDFRSTLAEVLREHGYRTSAVVSHTLVSSKYNLDQGFDEFDESHVSGHLGVSSPGVTETAVEWLRSNSRSPFFLFLHYFDPHYAYIEHEGYEFSQPYEGWVNPEEKFIITQSLCRRLEADDIRFLTDRYDSEIAFTDHHIELVLDELRRLGLEGSTVIVLAGDHGEEFMEHGWLGHTRHLYEELIRVPLILYNPAMRQLPDTFEAPAELIDVMPTLLEMLKVDWDAGSIDGRSLLGVLEGKAAPDSVVFSEVSIPHVHALGTKDWQRVMNLNLRSMQLGRWKLIHDVFHENWQLYDLISDPGETMNLVAQTEDGRLERMETLLLDWMEAEAELALAENTAPDTLAVVDEESKERLRALGYVH